MKYVVVLPDGVADVPIKEIGEKTPLEMTRRSRVKMQRRAESCWFLALLTVLPLIGAQEVSAKPLPLSQEEFEQLVAAVKDDSETQTRLEAAVRLETRLHEAVYLFDQSFDDARMAKPRVLFDREESPEVKLAIGIALAHMGDQTVTPYLCAVLRQEQPLDVGYHRPIFLSGLSVFLTPGRGLSENLRQALERQYPEYTLARIIEALRLAHDRRAVGPLIQVYEQAKQSLTRMSDGSIEFWLSAELAAGAAYTLGELGAPEARALLIQDLQHPKSELVGVMAAQALAFSLEDPGVQTALLDALRQSPSESIRVRAAVVLEEGREDPRVRDALVQSVRDDSSRFVRSQVLSALWGELKRSAYVRQLEQETDRAMQLRLLDELLAFSDPSILSTSGDELSREQIETLRRVGESASDAEIQARVSSILNVEVDNQVELLATEWRSAKEGGFGLLICDGSGVCYDERLKILECLQPLRPYLSERHLRKLAAFQVEAIDPTLRDALSNFLQRHGAFTGE